MWLCKFFSLLSKICIILGMKRKKKYLQTWNNWKKKIASFFWLDDCAGGLCIRDGKRWRDILVVLHKDGGVMIPKWKVKPWESLATAALREFQEETGLYSSRLGKKIGVMRDRLRRKKIHIYKIDNIVVSSLIRDEAVVWMSLEKALIHLRHKSEKKFLEKYLG